MFMLIDERELEELATLEMEEIKELLTNFLSLHYGLPYELDSRVKSLEKLKRKQRLHENRGIEEEITDIKDIIGLRIAVDEENEVIRLKDLMEHFMEYTSLKDQFTTPRYTGFKAYSYYYTCFGFNTEIQIMTKNMRDWTNATHKEHDERKYELNKVRTLPKE